MKFIITEEQQVIIDNWLIYEVYPQIVKDQKKSWGLKLNKSAQYAWENNYPYGGVSGGGVTYCFTPTSIGVVFSVEVDYGTKKYRRDFTDYGEW